MTDDVVPELRSAAAGERAGSVHRLLEWRRLARQDRRSAELARLHGRASVLTGAGMVVGVGWARSHECARCGRGATSSAAPAGWCVVCALFLGSETPASDTGSPVHAALELTWRTLHRGRHRPVHWNPAPVMRSLQAAELTRWNDGLATAPQVAALLRRAQHAAHTDLGRVRAHA